jgi:cellulose synthase/poly-beta-1,6-N-acetylglucosamine synthase-like glycosyltransferase
MRRRVVLGLAGAALLLAIARVTWFATPLYAGLYAVVNFMLFADLFDLIVRRALLRKHTGRFAGGACPTSVPVGIGTFTDEQIRLHLKPYAFLLAVHNMADEVEDFIEAMLPFKDRVWIIDDASTDATPQVLRRAGFRCVQGTVNQKKPGAIRQLLRQVDPKVRTVIVMDPDCRLADDVIMLGGLERRIFEFQRSGMAALTPRIRLVEAGLMPTLQAFEYALTFSVLRKSLGDHCVTSGLSIYRRDALESVLDKHDLSVYAEDLENAVILLSERERIYYDERLVFETVAKRTLGDLFSQRVGWYFGLLHVYATQLPRIRSFWRRDVSTTYHFLVYAGALSILLHPVRLLMLLFLLLSTLNGIDVLFGLDLVPDTPMTDPSHFVIAYVQYTLLMTVLLLTAIERPERTRLGPAVPLFFFYALALVVPTTIGYVNWLSLRLRGRRVYDDHYDQPGSTHSVLSSP